MYMKSIKVIQVQVSRQEAHIHQKKENDTIDYRHTKLRVM